MLLMIRQRNTLTLSSKMCRFYSSGARVAYTSMSFKLRFRVISGWVDYLLEFLDYSSTLRQMTINVDHNCLKPSSDRNKYSSAIFERR